MKCFYHSADLDGKCSGAIVKLQHPQCELIGINYNDPFPWGTISADETIFMVDYAIPDFTNMVRLRHCCGNLIWIDHHRTALDDRDCAEIPFNGLQKIGQAGCELTWTYFHGAEDMPKAVFMLGRYDVWDWQQRPGVMEFQTGMWQQEADPNNSEFWRNLFINKDWLVEDITRTGTLLLAYKKKDNASRLKTLSYETELDGLRLLAINHAMTNSTIFDDGYDSKRHDGMLSFAWYRDHWKVSLYSAKDHVDVSAVCKLHGGGGHKGAAGFQCDVLPFSLVSI